MAETAKHNESVNGSANGPLCMFLRALAGSTFCSNVSRSPGKLDRLYVVKL